MVPRLPVVLASASPRRRELLSRILREFEVYAPEVDETSDVLPLERRAQDLAICKAMSVPREGRIVIGADTIVGLGDESLGKPADADEAAGMLARLSGDSHRVITGVALVWPGGAHVFQSTTWVTFRNLSDAEIRAYAATEEPLDKAGGYAIQGGAAAFAADIKGDIDTVVGLPVAEIRSALLRLSLAD